MKQNLQNKQLILFAGGMGAGKDTAREMLIDACNYSKEYHFSFAKPLKDELDQILKSLHDKVSSNEIKEGFNLTDNELESIIAASNKIFVQYPVVNARTRQPEIRKLLQILGTDIRRKKNENYWVDLARKEVVDKLNEGYTVIMTDGRFKNEFDLINELGGLTICLRTADSERIKRIERRDGVTPSQEALHHASELDWRTYGNFDYIINNTDQTLEETREELLKIIERNNLKWL